MENVAEEIQKKLLRKLLLLTFLSSNVGECQEATLVIVPKVHTPPIDCRTENCISSAPRVLFLNAIDRAELSPEEIGGQFDKFFSHSGGF